MSSSSEYFDTSPTKRTSALKLRFVNTFRRKKIDKITQNEFFQYHRPSVLNSPAHVMIPSNLNLPWSPCEMSWAMQSHSTGVVEFKGQSNNSILCKRKAEQAEQ